MGRTGVMFLVCFGLAITITACTRTSDGTVVMKRPPSFSSLLPAWAQRQSWASTDQPPAAVPEAVPAEVAPPDTTRAPRVANRRGRALLPGPATSLACHDQTQPGGRVRVVCQ